MEVLRIGVTTLRWKVSVDFPSFLQQKCKSLISSTKIKNRIDKRHRALIYELDFLFSLDKLQKVPNFQNLITKYIEVPQQRIFHIVSENSCKRFENLV